MQGCYVLKAGGVNWIKRFPILDAGNPFLIVFLSPRALGGKCAVLIGGMLLLLSVCNNDSPITFLRDVAEGI